MAEVKVTVTMDHALREYARNEAETAGLSLSDFIARAVQQAVAKASADRAMRDAVARGECSSCGYAPCMCDQA